MTGNRPNKVNQELNRNTHVTERPPPGRRVPRRNSSTGEGGRAPWRPVQGRILGRPPGRVWGLRRPWRIRRLGRPWRGRRLGRPRWRMEARRPRWSRELGWPWRIRELGWPWRIRELGWPWRLSHSGPDHCPEHGHYGYQDHGYIAPPKNYLLNLGTFLLWKESDGHSGKADA